MNLFSALQPLCIIAAAGIGILAGTLSPALEARSGAFIEPALMLMLFFVFLSVDVRAIRASFSAMRFAALALLVSYPMPKGRGLRLVPVARLTPQDFYFNDTCLGHSLVIAKLPTGSFYGGSNPCSPVL